MGESRRKRRETIILYCPPVESKNCCRSKKIAVLRMPLAVVAVDLSMPVPQQITKITYKLRIELSLRWGGIGVPGVAVFVFMVFLPLTVPPHFARAKVLGGLRAISASGSP